MSIFDSVRIDIWEMTEDVVAEQVTASVAFKELAGRFGVTAERITYCPAHEKVPSHLACNIYGYDKVPLGRWSGNLNDLLALVSTLRTIGALVGD